MPQRFRLKGLPKVLYSGLLDLLNTVRHRQCSLFVLAGNRGSTNEQR